MVVEQGDLYRVVRFERLGQQRDDLRFALGAFVGGPRPSNLKTKLSASGGGDRIEPPIPRKRAAARKRSAAAQQGRDHARTGRNWRKFHFVPDNTRAREVLQLPLIGTSA